MTQSNRPPILLPVLTIAVGVVLLLTNFLLLENVNLLQFWPLLLIGAGIMLLVRGDLGFTWHAQSFGITRGNVQTAQLEANGGELDINIRALRREGRLIAGQYTARSRPVLGVKGTHARLTMQRGQTWLLSLADWEIGLSRDLPWSLLISTFLGNIDADLHEISTERACFGSGFGDLTITAPSAAPGGLQARSNFGSVTLIIPAGMEAIIKVHSGRFARLHVDEARFLQIEPGVYGTLNHQAVKNPLLVKAGTTFGQITLS